MSLGLLILILATLFIKRARKYGLVISHIYAIIVGLLSYALFTTYLQNLGAEVFYKNIILAIGAFIAFGIIGYDASSMGKYLFVTLIALIIAGIIGIFINNPIFHTVITIVSLLLFLLYTLYDFNRMKRGQFSPREMGFNLFINLLNIIEDILSLANRFKTKEIMNELKDVIVFLYQRVSGFSFNVELSTRHIFLYLIEKMK